ncbi:MAG: Uma2 family endonuclease [Microscillaceae bacterium]|nr:Uma2 family endonuclease [Microscillaceae bacterium]
MEAKAYLPEEKYYSKAEYFALEKEKQEKYEYHDGQVYAMSGGTLRHSLLCSNIVYQLNGKLRSKKDCLALESNLKIDIFTRNHYLYADAFVICGKPVFSEDREDIVQNPVLIVEVLSKSTESYDRTGKFDKYRSLPSFKEYVLIAQSEMRVEVFFKQDESHWFYRVYTQPEETVALQAIAVQINVKDIYDKVELGEEMEEI